MGHITSSPGTEVSVRRKAQDGWFVYTCDQLPGLYVAHADDRVAYDDLPRSISALIKLDFGMDCTVVHKVSYREFVRACASDESRKTMEDRTQDLISNHDGQYFQFILQQVANLSR